MKGDISCYCQNHTMWQETKKKSGLFKSYLRRTTSFSGVNIYYVFLAELYSTYLTTLTTSTYAITADNAIYNGKFTMKKIVVFSSFEL